MERKTSDAWFRPLSSSPTEGSCCSHPAHTFGFHFSSSFSCLHEIFPALTDPRDSRREFLERVTLQLLHQAVPSFVSPGSSDGLIYNLSPPLATTPLSSNQLLLIQSQYTPQTPNNVNGAAASVRRCWCWVACRRKLVQKRSFNFMLSSRNYLSELERDPGEDERFK